MESTAVMTADHGWSHVGLLVRGENGALNVIHAAPAEEGQLFAGVRMETMESFAAHALKLGIYRHENERVAASAARKALHYLGRPFDDDLNENTDERIFCTELVNKAFVAAGQPLNVTLDAMNIPILGRRILVMPSTFTKVSGMKRIF